VEVEGTPLQESPAQNPLNLIANFRPDINYGQQVMALSTYHYTKVIYCYSNLAVFLIASSLINSPIRESTVTIFFLFVLFFFIIISGATNNKEPN
jgi:hypothetical protein